MPTYTQKVSFYREFKITAKNAREANGILDDQIRQAEWDANLTNDGFYDFEDEPVTCPQCNGDCFLVSADGKEESECPKCKGEGVIEFQG